MLVLTHAEVRLLDMPDRNGVYRGWWQATCEGGALGLVHRLHLLRVGLYRVPPTSTGSPTPRRCLLPGLSGQLQDLDREALLELEGALDDSELFKACAEAWYWSSLLAAPHVTEVPGLVDHVAKALHTAMTRLAACHLEGEARRAALQFVPTGTQQPGDLPAAVRPLLH